jgi:hypothetical protein
LFEVARMWVRNGLHRPQGYGVASASAERCRDCGLYPEMYLVKDRLWREAGLGLRDGLCIACLGKRLGRPLEPRDFLYQD